LDADFQKMRAKYPDDFAFTFKGDATWRERQAAASEWDGDWDAAIFHLDILMQVQPDDPSLRERRARAQAELDKLTAGDEIIPMVVLSRTSLRDAVTTLAKQANLNLQFDPALPSQNAPNVDERWRNVTPLQALQALLDNYGWQMTREPGPIALIGAMDPNAVGPQWTKVNLLENRQTNGAAVDEVAPVIAFDGAPLGDGIHALALQAGLNIQFDPQLASRQGVILTEKWKNFTVRQVMQSLLDKFGLQATQIPGNPILRIAAKNP
jgi:hypothetical protein